uniref:Uncharacterized protein n=1 Tax=Romanomermis culicivorax TaxID=13658 RepID=A0A915JJ07_ROMCU
MVGTKGRGQYNTGDMVTLIDGCLRRRYDNIKTRLDLQYERGLGSGSDLDPVGSVVQNPDPDPTIAVF